MRLNIHHYHHGDREQATLVTDKIDILMARQEILMDLIDRLVNDVQKQQTVIASMEQFIVNLKHQIADALSSAVLPPEAAAKLAAIFPTLEGNTDRISAAIVENTEAAPPADTTTTAPANPAPDVGDSSLGSTSTT